MGSTNDWSGARLTNPERKRARILDKTHQREHRLHRHKNVDLCLERVCSAIKINPAKEHP